MIVVGGIYRERCPTKNWDQIFGSAGRAACCLAGVFGQRVSLHGWFDKKGIPALEASFGPYGIDLHVRPANGYHEFNYFHPLSVPFLRSTSKSKWQPADKIRCDVGLVFGAYEGMPTVVGRKIVVDPQNESLSDIFIKGRIVADHIAIVANKQELSLAPKKTLEENIRNLFRLNPKIRVVVAKMGIFGALVFRQGHRRYQKISPYRSRSVFKIGSGDVFSAAFAYAWAAKGRHVEKAADFASRTVACYVSDPYFNFTIKQITETEPLSSRKERVQIYLAAPFFNLSDTLILAEGRRSLLNLGVRVFSPLHHVGTGPSKRVIVKKDIAGLMKSNAVLALLHNNDPGTLFEIGYARANKIPVVAFSEQTLEKDITMLLGTNCEIEDDFCSALYKTGWAGMA